MNANRYQPIVHRLAVTTASLALLPIVMGALVTTLEAGMAFLDWPSSDGHNMFFYPWFASLRNNPEKFVEHGHRLAGALIGMVSILLVVVVWKNEPRRWVRLLAVGVLLSVIFQGLLGGARVRMDERTWAMLHGIFAAIVFTIMCALALFTSQGWLTTNKTSKPDVTENKIVKAETLKSLKPWIGMTVLLLACQYFLGGMLRHLGMSLHEHIGMAVVVFIMTTITAIRVFKTGHPWLRGSAVRLLFLLFLQVALGLGAFATRFGVPALDYVAVQNSRLQAITQTSHTVIGILLFATTNLLAIRIFHLDWQQAHSPSRRQPTTATALATPLSSRGGVS